MIPYVDLVAQNRALEGPLTAAFQRVLRHGGFILGREVAEFEARLAERLGVAHVIGVSNGTDALLVALRAHGIGPGDEVITVSHTYFATVSAILMVGAVPVMVDLDEETMLIDPRAVEAAITPRTRAVLPVHLGGHACDMGALEALCASRGLVLVEDAAQSIGATWGGRCVGSFGTGCFSLHPLKVLGALGDAGFITTDDDALAAEMRILRTIGHADRDHVVRVSGNTRLDALHAALLGVKLDHLDAWIAARRDHVRAYRAAFAERLRLASLDTETGVHSTFVIRHPERDRLLAAIREGGVDAKVHYPLPCHRQEAFAHLEHPPLPVTERVVSEMISLPVSPELSPAQRGTVIEVVLKAVEEVA